VWARVCDAGREGRRRKRERIRVLEEEKRGKG